MYALDHQCNFVYVHMFPCCVDLSTRLGNHWLANINIHPANQDAYAHIVPRRLEHIKMFFQLRSHLFVAINHLFSFRSKLCGVANVR